MAEAAETIESGQDIAGYASEDTEAEEGQESANVPQPSFLDALFTPEGITMFSLAVIVDVLEIVLDLTGVGAVVAFALDVGAYIIIGGWMMARGSDVQVSKRAAETLKKGAKQISAKIATKSAKLAKLAKAAKSAKAAKWNKRLKWIRPAVPLFELIPFVSIVPCWIVAVYFELKYGKAG